MTLEDVPAASLLANAIFKVDHAGTAFDYAHRGLDDPKVLAFFGADTILTEYYVAETETVILGTSGLYAYSTRPTTAWLGWFCVAPELRGQGIGDKLFVYAADRAKEKGFTALKLWTGHEDKAAHRLYRRHGMKIVKRDEDKLFFRKTLR
jgi:GNAT superfamily N-acetyltransferase